MKAVIWSDYGPPEVLQLKEVEKPAPRDNEVLICICAAAVTAGDCEQRSLNLPIWYRLLMRMYVGIRKPERITILGMELAGEIESVGEHVKRFKVGDQVFAATSFADMGTYAEYICLPEEPVEGALAIKPTNLSYQEAATVPVGGLEALDFIRKGQIQPGNKVLINGAGGTIGTFAVQLAKYFGAVVTGVDSTEKLDLLRSIGVDHVVDYTQVDFTTSGQTYDFILDVVSKSSFSGSIRSLSQNGRYLIANPGPSQFFRGWWTSMMSTKEVIFGGASPNTEDLIYLRELVEAGVITPVIDKIFPLEQAAEAHRYVEIGHKKGHVVLIVDQNNK